MGRSKDQVICRATPDIWVARIPTINEQEFMMTEKHESKPAGPATAHKSLERLSEMDRKKLQQLVHRASIARDVHTDYEGTLTIGQRVADKVAEFGGSWTFILLFGGAMALWLIVNTIILATRPFDPYPFILLNLILSTIAALQAPVIMMSQNRQASKDRLVQQHDYEVNLKAEIEILALHDKLDEIRHKQFVELLEIQQTQIDMLSGLAGPKRRKK